MSDNTSVAVMQLIFNIARFLWSYFEDVMYGSTDMNFSELIPILIISNQKGQCLL